MFISRCLLIISLLSLASCASYLKRQECNKINWFKHGQEVAMRGEWLNSDKTLNECRKVDAEVAESQLDKGFKSGMATYCTPENSRLVGKSGDLFSRELCEGPQINVILAAHKSGVREYCEKSNGYTAGTSGKKYAGICSVEQEKAFLPEYRKGRKIYVENRLTSLNQEVSDKENKLSSTKMMGMNISQRLNFLEADRSMLQARHSSAESSKNFNEASYLSSQIGMLDSEISSRRSEYSANQSAIRSLEKELQQLHEDVRKFREELATLQ